MRAASTACTVGGTWISETSLGETMVAAVSGQHPGLDESAATLLKEERVSSRSLDQDPGQCSNVGPVPEERLKEDLGGRGAAAALSEAAGNTTLPPQSCRYSGR